MARAYFARLLDAGELDAADGILDPAVRFHYPMGELEGAAAVKAYVAAVRAAIPDFHFSVEDLIAEDGRVAARWRFEGTRTGELRGRPATGARSELPGNTVFHLAHGRIRELWIAFDPARLL